MTTQKRSAAAVGPLACVIVLVVGLPRQMPPDSSGSGHGPFGEKAFKGALIGCVVIVIVGVPMVLVGGQALRSVGVSFMVLGVLGLVTGGGGLVTERVLARRPPPSPEIRQGNGRGPQRRIDRGNGRRPRDRP
jgi:hypothetical protein